MIKSMTGFGTANYDSPQARITVEIKSLNSKFLELFIKLPKSHADKELYLRNECNKSIERGKASINISLEKNTENTTANINTKLLNQYYAELKAAAANLAETPTNLFQLALQMPEVISHQETTGDEEEWKLIMQVYTKALSHFNAFREQEGTELEKDLKVRITNIIHYLGEVEKVEHKRLHLVKERLKTMLIDAVGAEAVDNNRLEQELIYYIDKLDITEEKVRLKSHAEYFLSSLSEPESNGKKLGFICQEIGREINTMGAKSNDASMQKAVVGMKEELEKIKEQLLNVL